MVISALLPEQIPAAAELFAARFRQLRERLPILPDTFADPACAAAHLSHLVEKCPAFAAVEGGRLVGYMGGWIFDNFRDTPRRAAYVPEWAHAIESGSRQRAIHTALYRAAAAAWFEAGCQAHAVTLLAGDEAEQQAWFWNGFGLTVVDAVRPLTPIGAPIPTGYQLRKATPADAEALAEIEHEHWLHYAEPPTLMTANDASNSEEFARFLSDDKNAVWAAWQGERPVSYHRFEGSSFGAADIVNGEGTIAVTGTYTRPAHRGKGLAPALLDAALRDYAGRGFERCTVDFESINPEAAAFWPRYFELACLSVIRVPEREKGQ